MGEGEERWLLRGEPPKIAHVKAGVVLPDGEQVWVVRASRFDHREAEFHKLLDATKDMVERSRFEEAQAQLEADLERAQEALKEIAGGDSLPYGSRTREALAEARERGET